MPSSDADRTVANELQHGSTQSSLACTSCRRKKLKCDRSIPQCRNCQKVSRACEYPAVAHKPGPRPGTHRRNGDIKRPNANQPHSIASYQSPDGHGSQHTIESGQSPTFQFSTAIDSPFSVACKVMHLPEQSCMKTVQDFLENMTSFGLFHHPTVLQKLATIESPKQIQALLTTMLAFNVRFIKDSESRSAKQPIQILEDAYKLGQECLNDCSDESPPLCLLQILILQAFMFSTLGVRGKVWRLVGQCIRSAYELRLHEIDLDQQDWSTLSESSPELVSESWVEKEEKRRAWWAVWECDIFASTIQRLPNGIDWERSRTNLPSTDEAWFNNNPSQSCYLRTDLNKRWRDLRDSGNESPIAWFVVLNSYKWESLSITQRLTPPTTFFENEADLKDKFDPKDYRPVLARKRELLENCLRCALHALPSSLQPDGYLSFEPSRTQPYPNLSLARDHGIYMIHLMSQVTQLMLARKDLEGGMGNYIAYPADFTLSTSTSVPQSHPSHPSAAHNTFTVPPSGSTSRNRWQRCLLIADQMASVVRSSAPHHYKFVNPNLATALWMAAATLTGVIAYHPEDIDLDLARSNLDLLTSTIERFIEFWDVPKTLLVSLRTLGAQLKAVRGGQVMGSGCSGGLVDGNGYQTPNGNGNGNGNGRGEDGALVAVSRQQNQTQPLAGDGGNDREMSGMPHDDPSLDPSPFDVLQAMDFGAMYNGVEDWENLFLDPGVMFNEFAF